MIKSSVGENPRPQHEVTGPAAAENLRPRFDINTRECHTNPSLVEPIIDENLLQHARALHKTQDASTTNAYGQRQWQGNLLDVCCHRKPLLARTAYTTVQHDRCDPTRRHPNPKKGGVALFYWITINADARPTEGGAVEEIEP